jgi:hypothetical protein
MRKRCIRKHYTLVNTIANAIEGAAIIDTERLDKLRMIELQSLEAFRTGAASRQDWNDLADMCNVCETMARAGIGPEALEPCLQAQDALGEARRRHLELGRIATTGPELQALRTTWEFHDLQRSSVSRAQYQRAVDDTRNRIRSAHPSLKVKI